MSIPKPTEPQPPEVVDPEALSPTRPTLAKTKLNLHYGERAKRIKTSCEICNNEFPTNYLHQHRIIPGLRYGGSYADDNVIIICRFCHKVLHKLIDTAKKQYGNLDEFKFTDFVKATKTLRNGEE